MTTIGNELAEARRRAGWTQADTAGKLGVTQSRLSQIERGQNTRVETVQSYARALGLELVLVPQQQLRNVRSLLGRDEPVVADEVHPSRFPSLADLLSQEPEGKGARSRGARRRPK
jgi:transcriptional regulator with XRE-family HTH domain